MRILITNIRLASFGGTEMVVELLAEGLRRLGHDPMLYSPSLGPQAAKLRERGFVVVDRMAALPHRPDIIHAQHTPPALAALAALPDVPAVFACHSSVFELEAPRHHAQIRKWIAVDELCRRRCLSNGIAPDNIEIILNAVDLDRFTRRAPLPASPKRALLLTKNTGHHEAVRNVCARRGIALDELGAATGRVSDKLETELLGYDVVFATARMALEAAAVGCAVIVCDGRGFAGMLDTRRLSTWRRFNLGLGLLTTPTTEAALDSALDAYDAADALQVCEGVRAEASFQDSARRHVEVYEAALGGGAETNASRIAADTARWIEDLTPTGEARPWRALAQEAFGIAAPPMAAVLSSMERRLQEAIAQRSEALAARIAELASPDKIADPRFTARVVNATGSEATAPRMGYAICTTPRSGSNYLCQLLASTGQLGNPLEYFNAPARRAIEDPTYPDDRRAQVQRVLTSGSTPNGVYGVKLFPWQLRDALATPEALSPLTNLHFVRLKRRDRLAQAISWLRALQSGQYRSTQQPRSEIAYDGPALLERVKELARTEASWDIYFARTGLAPLVLFYEEVTADPAAAVRRITALLGLDAAAMDHRGVDLAPQRDAVSEAWRERFLLEHGQWRSIEVLSGSY